MTTDDPHDADPARRDRGRPTQTPEPAASGSGAFTYNEVGATRNASLPATYHHLLHHVPVATGTAGLRAAADALLTWQMHQAAGLRVLASAPRAEPSVTVTSRLGLGPLRISAPCQVVWVDDDPGTDSAGFAYGTLPGHPESGEESFVLTRDSDDVVWLTIRAFSRPATLLPRLAGPVGPMLQRHLATRFANVLRRLADAAG
ncbi:MULTISPECIES: DUF1990 family protein [unclassified Pseudofrankia]|uniref:DUF1990 family protein n=1 Tax=unclassified Pseudofrankia TaxID=2994372 RepID=UPI0009F3EDA6|nr:MULTISPECIES: DUF1990 domain-containing protein [unclassified Pseudofrankia]MDT3441272.1 DUF1990 domain-containing protein [Pseudofrankia sp. BMG5.37]